MHQTDRAPRQLSLEVTLGADKFAIAGDLTLAEAMLAFKVWSQLRGAGPADEEAIRKITADITDETRKDAAEVAASSVPTP